MVRNVENEVAIKYKWKVVVQVETRVVFRRRLFSVRYLLFLWTNGIRYFDIVQNVIEMIEPQIDRQLTDTNSFF